MKLAAVVVVFAALVINGSAAAQDAAPEKGGKPAAEKKAEALKKVGVKKAESKPQDLKGPFCSASLNGTAAPAGCKEDPNVKDFSELNKLNGSQKLPTGKKVGPDGKAKFTDAQGTRWCIVNAQNYSPYIVQIFVDGTYRGAVGGMSQGDTITLSGPTTLYARALFDDGSVKTWGPSAVSCGDNFTWQLSGE